MRRIIDKFLKFLVALLLSLPFALKLIKRGLEWIGLSTSPEDAMGLVEKLEDIPLWAALIACAIGWATYIFYPLLAKRAEFTTVDQSNKRGHVQLISAVELLAPGHASEQMLINGTALRCFSFDGTLEESAIFNIHLLPNTESTRVRFRIRWSHKGMADYSGTVFAISGPVPFGRNFGEPTTIVDNGGQPDLILLTPWSDWVSLRVLDTGNSYSCEIRRLTHDLNDHLVNDAYLHSIEIESA